MEIQIYHDKQLNLDPLIDLAAYRDIFEFPIQNYYQKAGFNFDKTPYEVLAGEYMKDYQEKSYDCQLFEDVYETLRKAHFFGFPQCILSASRKDYLLKQIEKFDILDYVDSVHGIENIYASVSYTHLDTQLVVFPELALSGYTCQDLLLEDVLLRNVRIELEDLVSKMPQNLLAIVGLPLVIENRLYNCAAFIRKNEVLAIQAKTYIPSYNCLLYTSRCV